jgi:hypothetical protein
MRPFKLHFRILHEVAIPEVLNYVSTPDILTDGLQGIAKSCIPPQNEHSLITLSDIASLNTL